MRTQLLLALLASGCAVEPPQPARSSSSRSSPTAALCTFTLDFDPPLPRPANLTILHESGWSWTGEVAPTGAELQAPPGPANLLLQLQTPRELVVKIADDMPSVHWRIPKN